MYSGDNPKGSSTTIVSSASDVSRTTLTLNIGNWTASEIADARVNFQMTNGASSTHRYLYVYGVSFNVVYDVNGVVYSYTINNIQEDHTINVSISQGATSKWYYKVNGTWREVRAIYYKQHGSWVRVAKMFTKVNGNWNN